MDALEKYSNTANRWFEETISNAGTRPFLDECLVATLVVAKKYTKAFFLLLENYHILPAKAMLRILAELFIKVAWCLDVENKNSNDKQVTEKLKMWVCHTETERCKGLEKCLKATKDEHKIAYIKKCILEKEKYLQQFPSSIKGKGKFPSTFDLFTSEKIANLDSKFGYELYLVNYFLYNNAVHLDMCSIGNLIGKQNGTTFIAPDASDDNEILARNCLYQVLSIVLLIRKYYKQEVKEMIAEYDVDLDSGLYADI